MSDDPRKLGGDIAGPGGPHSEGTVVIDTRNAVLMDSVDVALLNNPSDARRFASLVLAGRVNRSQDRARVLYLFDADGAAAVVSELIGLAQREGGQFSADFVERLEARLAEMPR
jgi:hypothetical protein